MRALIIRRHWIDKILEGTKTWEIRGSRTTIRETIALIPSRSGTVIGVCDLVDCIGPLSADTLRGNARRAGMPPAEATSGYANTYAWVVSNPRLLKKPVRYRHPSGAVVWVVLSKAVERAVRSNLG